MTPPDAATALVLRAATLADADAISALTQALTQRWIAPDCTAQGAATLLESMTPQATAERLREGHHYLVATRDATLVGVAALRLPAHLYHLFVAEDAQRQGLARQLWLGLQTGVKAAAPITVNASRHALPMYLRLGFEATAPERSEGGIVFTPMAWRRQQV